MICIILLFSNSLSLYLYAIVLGEDDKYKASELDFHGPSVRGWLSGRNCNYPQEILFMLSSSSIIHQIQILAHHYIIRK